ncbi:protein expanded-like [Pollicipes pollicipes]|uniref:protein expanded-like n=1 Tax=Pollicipes pollicipes TaxID=41117 RepID=UPI001884947B|nr:protein expanded-like [Pollicipes pollicipes]
MRRPSVSLVASCAEPLSSCRKYVAVRLLTQQRLYFTIDPKCKLCELYSSVAEQMCLQGMQDPDLFGLAVILDGEYVFVDPENKIGKYAPKAWKTSQSDGLDASNQPLLQFSLRVKFYVECHLLLRDQVTRHHYYLQLRENVLAHGQACSRELCLLLAGWALQADLGDRPLHAGTQYFRPADYFPDWLIGQAGAESILNSTPAVHRHNRGMSSAQAELAYIREASAVEAPFNLHLYRLRRRKSDTSGSVLLGICPNGVELYQEEKNSVRKLIASFIWTNIGRLGFEKKKFEISALTQKFTFYTTDDEKSKQLFHLCKETHLFTQSAHDRLALIQQRSEEGGRSTDSCLAEPGGRSTGSCLAEPGGRSTNSSLAGPGGRSTDSCLAGLGGRSTDFSSPDQAADLPIHPSLNKAVYLPTLPSPNQTVYLPTLPSPDQVVDLPTHPSLNKAVDLLTNPLLNEAVSQPPPEFFSRIKRRTPASSLRRPRDLRPGWEYLQTSAGDAEQRVSVVSSTSSNATSGVVSDRTVPSLDDSDDDLQAELLAGCGAAESAESGVDSMTRSRSQLDAASPRSSQRSSAGGEVTSPARRRPADLCSGTLAAAGQVDIDYSVHSAHTSVGSVVTTPGSFPRKTTVSSTFETDSDYVQVPYDRHGQPRMAEPAGGVPMATVTTVTPVCVAQSCQTAAADERPPPAEAAVRVVTVPAAGAPVSGEASARFITARPPVTVLRACVAKASLLEPQPPPAALSRPAAPERSVAFSGNSCLDVRASHPAPGPGPGPRASRLALSTAQKPAAMRPAPGPVSGGALARVGPHPTLGHAVTQPSLSPCMHAVPTPSWQQSAPTTSWQQPAISAELAAAGRLTQLAAGPLLPCGRAPAQRASLATVYIGQLARSQIEQFQRQLLSNSDYVMYPLKDPGISRQEYMDARRCGVADLSDGRPPPPLCRAPKDSAQYRSSLSAGPRGASAQQLLPDAAPSRSLVSVSQPSQSQRQRRQTLNKHQLLGHPR